MRTSGWFVVASLLALGSVQAFAGSHGGGEVRDHRGESSSSSSSSSSHSSGGEVRDHRTGSSSSSSSSVRDHRGGGGDGGVIGYEEDDDTEVDVDSPAGGRVVADRPGPAWTLELGGLFGSFEGPSLTRSGTLSTDGGMYDYGVTGGTPSAGDTGIVGANVRGTFSAWPHLYLGAELQLGGVTRSPIHLMSGGENLGIASQAMIGFDGVAGARLRSGRVELDGEVAGGVRAISTNIEALDTAMQQDGSDGDPPVATEAATTPIVEGRLRAALWLTPHLFVAAQAGVGALDHSDVNLGIAIGTASRAFAEPYTAPL
jgi:hypothetical protein